MTPKVRGAPRIAIRRSMQARGAAVLARQGMTVSVAVNGRVHGGQITALVETLKLSSSGFASYVEERWHARREANPDEHPIRALHNARFYANAALNVAHRRMGRPRWKTPT